MLRRARGLVNVVSICAAGVDKAAAEGNWTLYLDPLDISDRRNRPAEFPLAFG